MFHIPLVIGTLFSASPGAISPLLGGDVHLEVGKRLTTSPLPARPTGALSRASGPGRSTTREVQMERITAKDGAKLAIEKAGSGPAVIVVGGALSHRKLNRDRTLVDNLARHFTVYTFDRRGRGESTDPQPYAVEREIEDIASIIDHAGGWAYLYGVSSGAALSMQAAAKLGAEKVRKLALYEPPYGQDRQDFDRQKERVNQLIKTGEPGEAAAFFLSDIGMPPEMVEGMKRSPDWPAIKKVDFTLAYDYAVLGDGAVPREIAKAITVPALVMDGQNSMAFMHATADSIGKLMPNAQRKTFKGQGHQVKADAMAPVLIEFFSRKH